MFKDYLLETFRWNEKANLKILEKIQLLPDQKESIRFISHLINSQNKWIDRLQSFPSASTMDWWEPLYNAEELKQRWQESINKWIELLDTKTEDDLESEVRYIGVDDGIWTCRLRDIALQLNYHSIHHRAQIQSIIRSQGFEPDFVDYIGTVARKLS
jgi:uncharacterized damage-inducible protein DinB